MALVRHVQGYDPLSCCWYSPPMTQNHTHTNTHTSSQNTNTRKWEDRQELWSRNFGWNLKYTELRKAELLPICQSRITLHLTVKLV